MKKTLISLFLVLYCTFQANAQFAVIDPANLAQGIVNTTKQIVETSTTAKNMIANFQETVKIYEQGKEYYDALKSVNNLVKDAKKVQQSILMVGDISDIYMVNFQKMMSDPNYSVDELSAIALGYTKLLEESGSLITDLKTVVTANGLSLSDRERMEVVDNVHENMRELRSLCQYYTDKNISVSYLRAKKINDTDRVMALYGSPEERYW